MKRSNLIATALLWWLGLGLLPAESGEAEKKETFQEGKGMSLATYRQFSALLHQLGERGTRAQAQEALKKEVPRAFDELVKGLQSPQALQRSLAAVCLGYYSEKKPAANLLVELLSDKDLEVRRQAAAALSRVADPVATDELVKALEDHDSQVRQFCILALGATEDDRAIAPLVKRLKEDTDRWNRLYAAQGLGRLKKQEALKGLEEALQEESDPFVRMGIEGSIRKITGKSPGGPEGTLAGGGKNALDFLKEISSEMGEVEKELRHDKHDRGVQVAQKNIEDKLTHLIKEVEKQSQSSTVQGEKQQKSQPQQGSKSQSNLSTKQPTSPMTDSSPSGSAAAGALRQAAKVSAFAAEWAKLPPHEREKMHDLMRSGIPEKYLRHVSDFFEAVSKRETKAAAGE